MRIWMAAASLALWAVSTQPDGLAGFDALFWHDALGWLQPGLATPAAGEIPAGLAPAPLQRELIGHAAG